MLRAHELLEKLIVINGGRSSLEPAVTAETILQGFKKLDDDVIQITLPLGTTIQEAGELLNAAAKEKGMEHPVFYEGSAEFWEKNEANIDLQTKPGLTYHFKISTDSVSKTKVEQVEKYNDDGAPLGAIAIAEACERLDTNNNGTLFKSGVWVRGSAPGVALDSNPGYGVHVYGFGDDYRYDFIAFAISVPARN